MATQYDIVKAYADLYYENASVKKDLIVLGFQFGPVNVRFAFKFDERGNIKNPGCLLMNDVYLLRPDVSTSQKEDFLNSFGEDCYFDEDDKINGLLSGGDDYITKPFSLRELEARIVTNIKREERHQQKTEYR